MQRIVVFISGRGSNLACLADACTSGLCAAKIIAVISDRHNIPGLDVALQKKLPIIVVDRKMYKTNELFEQAMVNYLEPLQPDWLVLAGFMRVLGTTFLSKFREKLVNIHPSLLPSFIGLDTHRRALLSGVRWHGATVHFVNENLDGGPIIAQAAVPVYLNDTVDNLAARVLKAEHRLLTGVMSFCVQGKIYLENNIVKYDQSLIGTAMSW